MNKNSASDVLARERKKEKKQKGLPTAKGIECLKRNSGVDLTKEGNSCVDVTRGGNSGGEGGRQRQNKKR